MKKLMDWLGRWMPSVWGLLATFCITAMLFGWAISAVMWIVNLLGGM